MRILHISTNDISSGAGKGAYILHRALIKKGVESLMLVQDKFSDDCSVISFDNKKQKILAVFFNFFNSILVNFYKKRRNALFSPSLFSFPWFLKKIKEINPDIIHLHWVNLGMVKISDLKKINKPIVWTLRDMWPFTGGCHYDENCGLYKEKCGNCKILNSSRKKDLSHFVWHKKNKVFSRLSNLTIVALSSWIKECAEKSSLFKDRKILLVPNAIDKNIFFPIDKVLARKVLDLPQNKKIILFGAIDAIHDKRKGFEYLLQMIPDLKRMNYEIISFGSNDYNKELEKKYKIRFFGYLNDNISLRLLYNSADVFIMPSIQDCFPKTPIESMSCGVPVVGFNLTGLRDVINHQKNGYLVNPFDLDDFMKGIDWVVNNPDYDIISSSVREKVSNEFDSEVVANKNLDLYKKIINEKDINNNLHI
ncbi:MAG: glycosyltransferase family 4 protein [Patescibacteria group bacterium]|jgi:glycosyltransferase involved in cell wall biosynthesis